MWADIKPVALEILRSQYPNATMADLDILILDTGYRGAEEPHDKISHLIHVYAASLRNAGGRGPGFEPFAMMVSHGSAKFITSNQILRPFDLSDFAQACLNYLCSSGASPLVKNGSVNYEDQLLDIASGKIARLSSRALLPQLLRSVVGFSELISRDYCGSAANYHAQFSRPRQTNEGASFVKRRFKELQHLPRFGVAVGMNFFKDSQVSAYRGKPYSSLFASEAGWYVKPDMHVLRFMLKLSGRAKRAGLQDESLVILDEPEAKALYSRTRPKDGWPYQYTLSQGRPFAEKGQWDCIEDVHHLAIKNSVAPLEIDRVLFMSGSGRFHKAGRISMSAEDRYRRMFRAM